MPVKLKGSGIFRKQIQERPNMLKENSFKNVKECLCRSLALFAQLPANIITNKISPACIFAEIQRNKM